MNRTLNTLIGAMLLAGSSSAFAASSVDLVVNGLITPSACTPTLANGGMLDYGKISAKDLKRFDRTDLEQKKVALNVTCDAPTLMALEPKDNREGSAMYDHRDYFGLGLINGTEKLGLLSIHLRDPVADNVPVRAIASDNGGTSWTVTSNVSRGVLSSVTDTSNVAPLQVQVLNANLLVWPAIAPTKDLTLTNEVPIDGSVTLTVRYL